MPVTQYPVTFRQGRSNPAGIAQAKLDGAVDEAIDAGGFLTDPVDLATQVAGLLALTNLAAIADQRILGNSSGGAASPSALATLPTSVQDAITRLGTIVAGDFSNTGLLLRDTGGDHTVNLKINEDNAANRVLNLLLGNADRSLDLGPAQTFTPVWAATGVAPVLNDGTLTGTYRRIGKGVIANISLTIGAATTVGTGLWTFSSGGAFTLLNLFESGICQSYDVSTLARSAGWMIPITTTTFAAGNIALGGGWQGTNPIAVPAVGDVYSLNIAVVEVA